MACIAVARRSGPRAPRDADQVQAMGRRGDGGAARQRRVRIPVAEMGQAAGEVDRGPALGRDLGAMVRRAGPSRSATRTAWNWCAPRRGSIVAKDDWTWQGFRSGARAPRNGRRSSRRSRAASSRSKLKYPGLVERSRRLDDASSSAGRHRSTSCWTPRRRRSPWCPRRTCGNWPTFPNARAFYYRDEPDPDWRDADAFELWCNRLDGRCRVARRETLTAEQVARWWQLHAMAGRAVCRGGSLSSRLLGAFGGVRSRRGDRGRRARPSSRPGPTRAIRLPTTSIRWTN